MNQSKGLWILIGVTVLLFASGAMVLYNANDNKQTLVPPQSDLMDTNKSNSASGDNNVQSGNEGNNQTSASTEKKAAANSVNSSAPAGGVNKTATAGETAKTASANATNDSSSAKAPAASPVPKKSNNPLAPDFVLRDLSGKQVKLSDYRGKMVILNFWASWCPPCKKEMPDFNELAAVFKKGNDIELLAVNVQEKQSKVEEFIKANNYNMHFLLDEDGAVSTVYNVTGIPTTYFIDREGGIFTAITGMTDKQTVLDILSKMKN